jgi:hypothetical protein
MTDANLRMLDCGEHGNRPWRGDIVCEKCGAIFLCASEAAQQTKFAYPKMLDSGLCTCGVQLMPTGDKSVYFSARSVCRACAERKK